MSRPTPHAPRPTPNRPRPGFTLWEMLLVLVILLAVTAITWPVARQAYAEKRIRRAARDVWKAISSTRLRAVDTSVAWQFRYEVGGRRWISVPWQPGAEDVPPEKKGVGELDEGLRFATLPGESVPVERLGQDRLDDFLDADALASVDWSPPILFFVDGSSRDGGFRVLDQEGRAIAISVRGLTGAVTVGPVEQVTQ